MVGQALRHSAPFQGLRRFDPGVDLGQMLELIRAAFADELDPGEISALRELRTLQILAPLLWLAHRTSTEFQDAFGGFVWVEEGRVVGNVTVTCTESSARLWLISNVAVHPSYRRRGIARELMIAALDVARSRGGQAVYLQVRHTNSAARALYRQLGFSMLDSNTDFRLGKIGPAEQPPAPGFEVRPWDNRGSRHAFDLARATVPEAWQRFQPLRPADFEAPGPAERLAEWIRGRQTHYWAVVKAGAYVATLVADAAWRGHTHRLRLTVRPDWQGQVEEYLITLALAGLRGIADRPVEIGVPTEHTAAIDALSRRGFVAIRTLDRMGLELVPRFTVPIRPADRTPSNI